MITEYLIKPVEITIKRELRKKGEKWRELNNSGYNTYIEMSQGNSPHSYLKQNKRQEGKTDPVWELVSVGGGRT
jgi:hypothetical protein